MTIARTQFVIADGDMGIIPLVRNWGWRATITRLDGCMRLLAIFMTFLAGLNHHTTTFKPYLLFHT